MERRLDLKQKEKRMIKVQKEQESPEKVMKEIEYQVSSLGDRAESLSETASSVREALRSVLHPGPPQCNKECEDSGASTQLGSDLAEIKKVVDEAIDTLYDILNRLELY